ncbi:unnamed protein product [Didymodactylos carnosus]|uniref:Cation-transporting P-type ATPase N-terminal domain-containing protein n=1 Tax=Didymodactylos carnosus TaxID=1234261 RepID=A0A814LWH2_9BILA|nr:unnamed protein product [Didymodactylos carnosus]CAF1070704.1 unnamed protein product [Didymodactylos carnosus]CAF3825634.1 unnamed protein product [Didymodactylos carnosus]CAF3837822.1 unnamed protein product [Didymodactylos carnosus]
MARSKKKDASKKGGGEVAGEGAGNASEYQITNEQLKQLMELRGKDLTEKLNADYGGIKGLLEKIKVDGQKGLESDNKQDLENRQKVFGKNEIPPKPMKSFLYLCWEALHDMMLIILLVCAVVSIGLSFYHPPHDTASTTTVSADTTSSPSSDENEGNKAGLFYSHSLFERC